MMSTRGGTWGAVMLAVAIAGCGGEGVTGVDLTIRHDPGLSLDAVRITGTVDGAPAFEPAIVPEQPRGLDPTGESVAIFVRDDLAGATLALRVEGMAGALPMASADVAVSLERHHLVPTAVLLSASDGGSPDAGVCTDGSDYECLGSCTCELDCRDQSSCPAECIDSSTCYIDCRDAGKCNATCRDDAYCELDCLNDSECDGIKCVDGARCVLYCNGDECEFAKCDGGQTSCGDDVYVCNQPCP